MPNKEFLKKRAQINVDDKKDDYDCIVILIIQLNSKLVSSE